MYVINRIYSTPRRYDLFITCHTHGWINLSPYSWDTRTKSLESAILIAGQAVDLSVRQEGETIRAVFSSEKKILSKHYCELDRIVSRILDLGSDTSELMALAGQIGRPYFLLVKRGAGRLLRGASLWEDAAKTLFTTNCSWALTQKMCKQACSSNYSIPTTSGRFPFPSASSLANEQAQDLRAKIPIGYRSGYLLSLASSFSGDSSFGNSLVNRSSYEATYERISKLMGFGPYAATHVMLLIGYFERIPIDSEVKSFIIKRYRPKNIAAFIERHYRPWGRYKWWGLKLEKMLLKRNWLGD